MDQYRPTDRDILHLLLWEMVVMRTRLVFEPETGNWRREKISEDDIIQDFEELTPSGVTMRFDRHEIAASLRQAAEELEQ